MDTLDVGETQTIVTSWWNEDGDPIEPDTIELTITKPDGSTVVKHKADMTEGDTSDVWIYHQVVDALGVWRAGAVATAGGTEITPQSSLFLVGETQFGVAPCEPWATWSQVENECSTGSNAANVSSLGPAVRDRLLNVATGILWSMDGRRYPGLCTTTRRVCRGCPTCGRDLCCCGLRSSIDLGTRWPAYGIVEIRIDGEIFPASSYRLRDRRFVDRIDGQPWPALADLTDPDAFTIEWVLGRRPPIELSDACAIFVAEMAKSCVGAKCELPARVTTVVREGVTYTILDSQKFLDTGRTGIYRVDLALAAAQRGRKIPPGMSSPFSRPGQHTARA